VEFGGYLNSPKPCATLSWEFNLNYQDLTDGFNGIDTGQSGKWNSARVGLKASFFPKKQSHPTVRAGLGWAIATGDTKDDFDFGTIKRPENTATNYFGGYVGVGWEWDFELCGNCFTTGPEFYVFGGFSDQGSDDYAFTGTVAWHFLWNF